MREIQIIHYLLMKQMVIMMNLLIPTELEDTLLDFIRTEYECELNEFITDLANASLNWY